MAGTTVISVKLRRSTGLEIARDQRYALDRPDASCVSRILLGIGHRMREGWDTEEA